MLEQHTLRVDYISNEAGKFYSMATSLDTGASVLVPIPLQTDYNFQRNDRLEATVVADGKGLRVVDILGCNNIPIVSTTPTAPAATPEPVVEKAPRAKPVERHPIETWSWSDGKGGHIPPDGTEDRFRYDLRTVYKRSMASAESAKLAWDGYHNGFTPKDRDYSDVMAEEEAKEYTAQMAAEITSLMNEAADDS